MLTEICKHEEMPTRRQFRHWLTVNETLAASYARARLLWADHWAERVMDISFNPKGGAIDGEGNIVLDHALVALLKLQTDNVKWLVGKWAPRTYGDKPEEGGIGGDSSIASLMRAIDGRTRTIETVIVDPSEQKEQAPPPPPQIEYHKPELPGDLSERDWSVMVDLLELVKRTIPSNSEKPAAEIFDVMRKALLAHFS